jgi:hypothetical protein
MRMLALCLLGFPLVGVALASSADDTAAPGRDGSYEFNADALEGTVWEGRLIPEAVMTVRFEKGGVLWYRYSNNKGGGSRRGSWKQNGDKVYLETNNKYAEYTAVIRGNRMIGEAHNVRPFQWTWEMERRPASANEADARPAPDPKGEKERFRLKESK